jgi:hypothetical protein
MIFELRTMSAKIDFRIETRKQSSDGFRRKSPGNVEGN